MPARIAVVGACSLTGRAHVEAFRRAGAKIVALVDLDPAIDALARRYRALALRDYRKAADIDAVVLVLPPRLHPFVATHFLRRGIDVLCEKPVATTPASGRMLHKEVRGRRFMTGFNFRFDAGIARLRSEIATGKLGRILNVCVHKAHPIPAGEKWRLAKDGGVTRIKDIHFYDMVPWLLGRRPVTTWATGGSTYHGGAAEDHADVVMTFDGGAVMQLRSAWWPFKGHHVSTLEVLGTRGHAVHDGKTLTIWRDRGAPFRMAIPPGEDTFLRQARGFLKYLRGGPCPVSLDDGLRALGVVEGVLRAMKSGTWTKL